MTSPIGASTAAPPLDYSAQLDDSPPPEAAAAEPGNTPAPTGPEDEAQPPSSIGTIVGTVAGYGLAGGVAGAALCKGHIACVGIGAIVGMAYATYKIDAALDRAEERLQQR